MLENLENIELFGNQIVDLVDLGELFLRFAVDLAVVFIIVRLIFYPLYKNRNYLFSYILINVSIFLVCILLSTIKLKIGFAFGLFAVFSIIRYRTEPIPIKEMTYLFVVIIIAVLNSLSVKKISYAEVLLSNAIMVFCVYALEYLKIFKGLDVKRVRYEKIELIHPEKRDELISDLKARTGLDIKKVDIERIDFLNDTARLKVFHEK